LNLYEAVITYDEPVEAMLTLNANTEEEVANVITSQFGAYPNLTVKHVKLLVKDTTARITEPTSTVN
jgi:hypothetical protein